jgi:eukaryotic-like serine/threonine-protein kinase
MLNRGFPRGALSLAALLGSVNASCVNFHPGPITLESGAAGSAPAERWTLRAGRAIAAPIGIYSATIYAAGMDRVVRAISIDSGKVRWTFRLSGTVLGGVVRADSSVYVASVHPEGNLLSLDAATGRKRWSTHIGEAAGPVALVGGVLLVATRAGDLMAVTPRDGVIHWRRHIGYARSAAVAAAGGAMIASLDSLFRVSVADGHVLARRVAPGAVLAPWRAAGNFLIGASTDSALVALRADDLSTAWEVRLDAPLFAAPELAGDTIFVASRIGSIYRAGVASGSATRVAALNWPLTSGPVLYGSRLLVGGADGTVRALSRDGGDVWRVAVWRPAELEPVPLPQGLLIIGGNGDFHLYAP